MENRISPEPDHSSRRHSSDQHQLHEMDSGSQPSNYHNENERIQFGGDNDVKTTAFKQNRVSPKPESPISSDHHHTYSMGSKEKLVPDKSESEGERIQFGENFTEPDGFRNNQISSEWDSKSDVVSDEAQSHEIKSGYQNDVQLQSTKDRNADRIQFGDAPKTSYGFKDNRISPVPEPSNYMAAKQRSFDRESVDPKQHPSHTLEDTDDKRIQFGDDSDSDSGICGTLLFVLSCFLVIITVPFSLIVCFKVVQEYERAVIFRLGRLVSGGAKGPGIFFVLPCIENYSKVDLRTVSFDVPPQEILTKDSVTVSVDAVVYYRVSNPTVSVANVTNAHHSTRLLAQTTLRNVLGTKSLAEILSDRESISMGVQNTLDDATDRWGIKVERTEIKDVRLPTQLQRAMAAEAEATREARAKVIAAEGEQQASRALKEAAQIIGGSPSALQLRYLQTLSQISAEKNSTIIFPLPIDLVKAFTKH